jgi:diguanylate cyclase (GGDEF)-like protein
MLTLRLRSRPWPVLWAIAFGFLAQPALGAPPQFDATTILAQTESLRTVDHPRFLHLLQRLNQQAFSMSLRERWHLRYLDAWQATFQGDYTNADPMLEDIIDHSSDPALVAKASALLMDDMRNNKRYEKAFELANRLVADLPSIQDDLARFQVLFYVSQLLKSAGQYDLAANYAREMEQTRPRGESSCPPTTMLLTVLYNSHKLTSSSPMFQQAIDACQASRQRVFIDTIWLVKSALYLDENQPQRALSILGSIAPGVHTDQYYANVLASKVQFAQAYLKLGEDDKARNAALATIANDDTNNINESLRDAYQVLYSIEKKHGNAAAALGYYEHYVDQDIGYLNDVSAKALAYDEAQQHTLAQKFETEKLSRQNNILQLQQALTTKAVETSRLYIAMLLMALVSIVFWLLRLKRSQLRFKQLSCMDGLTGISNHQHFMSEAARLLTVLEKRRSPACLVSIDLDYFKQVNDTHGHAIGDTVLRHTVALCQRQLRANDLFGRLGGEEFGILLVDCPREQGVAIADRIRRVIEATPVDVDGCAVSFSASVGLASTETSGYDLQRLCREADAALYKAKRSGRNRVIADSGNGGLVEA